jgi:predicted component of type VI protein secretion system
MATLCLLSDDGDISTCWPIGMNTSISVGRAEEESEVAIPDESLSRRHFVISHHGSGWILQDLQSANGTWVAGKRAVATPLKHHQCIVAGRCVFLFKEDDYIPPAVAPWISAPAALPVDTLPSV